MKPPNKPKITFSEALALLPTAVKSQSMCVLGIRGYYSKMGKSGNDRGIYDDAILVMDLQNSKITTFNGNTDPSVERRGIASLIPGVHRYRKGNHGISRPGGGYPAFRPATPGEALPVSRDGIINPNPGVAINIHKGSYNSTSSEGCQTIYPDQWQEFYSTVSQMMDAKKLEEFDYVLIENK